MSKSHDFSRRALNLSLAIYRTTAKFAQGEILSGQMRELCNRIAGDLAEGNFAAVEKKIERLKIYFEIARAQNWVKPINWSVLDFEYYKLQQEVIFELRASERSVVENEGKNTIVSHNVRTVKKAAIVKTVAIAESDAGGRQSRILAAVEKNEFMKMSDLLPLFNDVSERTLRNELQDMVKKGLIKKSGEKRHTTYLRG